MGTKLQCVFHEATTRPGAYTVKRNAFGVQLKGAEVMEEEGEESVRKPGIDFADYL